MFLKPRRRQLYVATLAGMPTLGVTAFWPFGDAFDAAVIADATGRGNSLTPYLRISPTTCQFNMGSNSIGLQHAQGAVKGFGRWNRILTSGEKAALYGKEYWPFATTTSLQDAKAYFKFDEAGGTTSYADSTGRGNTLTATGSTSQVTGPAGGSDKGAVIVDGITMLRTSPGTDLQSSQATQTVAGWVLISSKPAMFQQCYWTQLVNATPTSGFNVYYDPTCDRFALDNDGGDGQPLNRGAFVLANTFGSPALNTWYFLIAEFDVANNRTTLSVNNGTPDVLPRILQPTAVAAQIGNGSWFERNVAGSFSTSTSGWDADGYGPVIGNSRVSRSPNADVSIGNNSKTVWGWFKASDTSTLQILAGLTDTSGTNTDWYIKIQSNQISFVFGQELVTVSVALTDTANFHLIVCWFDKVNNMVHVDLDHGALTASAAGPATPHTVSTNLYFGAASNYQFAGILNAWGIANGTPTQSDLDFIWNSGSGVSV